MNIVALLPVTDIVAVAFLRTIAGIEPTRVNTTLPKDDTVVAQGFVQAVSLGGTPDVHLPWRNPVVTATFWAVNPTSGKPPWGKASQMAELVRDGCLAHELFPKTLNLSSFGDYMDARVHSAYLISEPHRVPFDEGSYARYESELQLHWTIIPE